ncbi:MAG: AEC family transporter [Oleispira sp.]|nr:AEC family transporter [Oleispira sp.]
MNYWQQLVFVGSITLPVFSLVFIGMWLKWRNKIDDNFTAKASYIVFNLALPVLMFAAIVRTDISHIASFRLIAFALSMAVISFLALWLGARYYSLKSEDLGVFVQASFRSNLGILGLAFCVTTFGDQGLAIGALLLAVITPLYNILSIYALTHAVSMQAKMNWLRLLKDVITNPLIVAILCALPLAYWQWQPPAIVMRSIDYLAAMTLPLALICIGGSLSFSALKARQQLSWLAVVIKLIILPLVVGISAYAVGFRGVELGCLVLMFASPTAAASFVMVRTIGGNHALAANIIALTTLVSLFTLSIIIYLLKVFTLI